MSLERIKRMLEEKAKKDIVGILITRIDALVEEAKRTNELLSEIKEMLTTFMGDSDG